MKTGDVEFTGSLNRGSVPTANDSSISNESVNAGQVFSNGIVSTYTLQYTASDAYIGGVLAPNGDIHFIHFVPFNAREILCTVRN